MKFEESNKKVTAMLGLYGVSYETQSVDGAMKSYWLNDSSYIIVYADGHISVTAMGDFDQAMLFNLITIAKEGNKC
ncbi:hypothetical protein ACRFHR_28025 [Klebsiella pneumoniae]